MAIATRSSTAVTMSMSQRCRRLTFMQTPSSPQVDLAPRTAPEGAASIGRYNASE
jgi:hypothetical protein